MVPTRGAGLRWGLLGVLAFSFTVPMTRIAVGGGAMSPLFVGAGRAVVAAVMAAALLLITRQSPPRGIQWMRLAVVAGGVVIGFPLLTSFALTAVPAAHGAVVIALLPAATAVVAVLRTGARPPLAFWALTVLGAVAACGFVVIQEGGFKGLAWPDLLLLGSVAAAAVGYAEGGLMARELGAWQTISWALVLSSPLMLALTGVAVWRHPPGGGWAEWSAFAYLGAISMFLGFLAWYRGLAIGPMTAVSQIQLTQPVMTICWAALLLGEGLTWSTVLGGLAVVACAAGAVRVKSGGAAAA